MVVLGLQLFLMHITTNSCFFYIDDADSVLDAADVKYEWSNDAFYAPAHVMTQRYRFRFPDLPLRRGAHDFNLFVPPHYLIGPTLGDGEFAVVKLTYNMKTGSYVALKCFTQRNGRYSVTDEQIIRESLALKGLVHEHIIRLHEVIIYGERTFLVLEHAPYGDLRHFINRGGALSEYQAREFFGHLILGVTKIHSHNLVHRDLKLENLLLDAKYNLKIADFGCARRQIDKNLHTITGSYAYGAPELFRGDVYDGKKADVWSMGIILFAMLMARLPFSDSGRLKQLLKERMKPPLLPSNLSLECRDLIEKLLCYDPERRLSLVQMTTHPWMNAVHR